MKISALRLFNVKRFTGRGVAIEGIGDGVNVLCAVNEYGKSTSFEALHALFFQPYSSTGADVRNLRPYAGGNPLVEADIVTEAGRYRITKQFYGGRSARVVDLSTATTIAQADEAENFIADLVRGGTAGPAGLLWVRQGVTGIEKRSRSEEDSEKQVRASLLESVQGEVEAITGGRRMAEIVAAAEEELGRLVTRTGRPKTGERYAAAIDERNRLEAEEQRLAAEVAALRDALDRRAAVERRLAELDHPGERDERLRVSEAAQAAYDAARTQAETLRAAEAEFRLVREQRDASAREIEAFRAARVRAEALDAKLQEAGRRCAEALARRDAASAAIAQARADSDAAEAEEQEARSLLARLDAALKAREAAGRLAELEQKLAAAEEARARVEEFEAAVAMTSLSDKAVAQLEALDLDIARRMAVAEAARPSVEIAYAVDAPRVSLNGAPLKDGEARSYEGMGQLDIPGIGLVTLRSGRASGADNGLHEALERRRELLASMGVEDLSHARRRQREAERLQSELRETTVRLSLLAPEGVAKLRQEVVKKREAADELAEPAEDPALLRAAHQEAEAKRLAKRQALREAEPLQAAAADSVVAAQTALAAMEAERVQIDAILGAPESRLERERAMAERLASLDARLSEKQAVVDSLFGKASDLSSAEATLRRVKSVWDSAERENSRLREEMAALAAEIRARSDDAIEENWREVADALAAAKSRVAAYEKEIAVLQRLCSALETARSHAQDTYLRPVMTELQPLLGLLFDDVSISFDEKTLLPHKILRNGQEEEVERLSGGMREQLSVLTRLAFARLLARDGRPAPVILDDALVYSDDDRIEKMFDALHRQARDQQIIVFSCRQRAFQKLGGTTLQMVEWTPE